MPERTKVTTEPTSLTLLPGETGEITITISNQGQTVDQLLLSIEGINPDWYTIPVSSVALFPNDQDNLGITIHPPKTSESQFGSLPIHISVTSQ